MGNCAGSKSSIKKRHKSKVVNETQGTIPSSKANKEDSKNNARKLVKKKGPVADNRLRIEDDNDAPTAIISERPKTEREKEELRKALLSHSLFNSLSNENVRMVIDQMKLYTIGPKEIVFNQGKPGNSFFIINTGKVEIIVNGIIKGFLSKGKGFGELALLHNSERTATIRTLDKATLWGIGRQSFRHAVETVNSHKYNENKQFVDSVPILSLLTNSQKDALLAVMIFQEFAAGHKIVVEGDPGDLLYIIKHGTVSCTFKGKEIRQLSRGEFFGEQALLYNTQRTATVTAVSQVKVLSLGRDELIRVLGSQLQQIIYRNSQRIAVEKSKTLKCLIKSQAETIIDKMIINSYVDGDVVIENGFPKKYKIWMVLRGSLTSGNRSKKIELFECIGDEDHVHTARFKYDTEYLAVGDTDVAEITWTDLEECIGGPLANVSTQNEVLGILRRVQLLRALPMQKLEALASVIRTKHYENKQAIFKQNDEGDAFYIVKEGQVDIFKDTVNIRTITRGDFFGERSIILNEKRTASVIANGNVACWVLEKPVFLGLIDEGIRIQLLKRIDLQDDSVGLHDLCPIKVLGKGMFGNVYLAINKKTQTNYAIKTVPRTKIFAYDIHENLILERKILLQIDHPLIYKLVKTFKDNERIYYLIEFVRGRDLFDVLRILNILTDDYSKFYAACIFLMLEHLHERNIIYRDLKPENVMVDEEGYPKMIDFGTAKVVNGRTYTVVGTPHYMAPEVIMGKGYGLSADYWCVGIMIYEFMCGGVPFGEDEEDPVRIYEKVLERRLVYPSFALLSLKAGPIIEQLLNKNPAMRGSVETIKNHSWFSGVNWDALLGKQLAAPHIPKLESLAQEIERGLKANREITEFCRREENVDKHEIPRNRGKAPPLNWDEDF